MCTTLNCSTAQQDNSTALPVELSKWVIPVWLAHNQTGWSSNTGLVPNSSSSKLLQYLMLKLLELLVQFTALDQELAQSIKLRN